MGILLSFLKSKESTESVLENLSNKISALQESRVKCSDMERKVASRMLIYSSIIYIVAAIGWYYWGSSFSQEWYSRLLYTLPFVLSPLLLVLLRRALRWFFVRRITKTEDDLKRLENEREEIFSHLMEKETYKKVVELMKKYCPEKLKDTVDGEQRTPSDGETVNQATVNQPQHSSADVLKRDVSPSQGALRHRRTRALAPLTGHQNGNAGLHPTPDTNHRGPGQQPGGVQEQPPNQQPMQSPQNPMLTRPILPQSRSTADRLIDWVLGDGLENRYALICANCFSHNGMALHEEFEFLAFRCAYCGHFNPAKKARGGGHTPMPIFTQNSLQLGSESLQSSRRGSQSNLSVNGSNTDGGSGNAIGNGGNSDNHSASQEPVEAT